MRRLLGSRVVLAAVVVVPLLALLAQHGALSSLLQQQRRPTPGDDAELRIGPVRYGGHNNYLYRDDTTAVQLVVSAHDSSQPARLLGAFPKDNTGFVAYFTSTSAISITLYPGSLTNVRLPDEQTGISGVLAFSGDFGFGVSLLGGVRAIREYVDGDSDGTVSPALTPFYVPGENGFSYARHWFDNRTTQWLHFEGASNAAFKVQHASEGRLPSVRVTRWNRWRPAEVRFTATFNSSSSPLIGLTPAEVFAQPSPSDSAVRRRVLEAIRDNATAITAQLSFLAYDSVFLGGGWRSLTYLGRDTLIALMLLMPVLSPRAIETILTAVIERSDGEGDDRSKLCHEELVGDYASYQLQNRSQSRCNYAVSDTHFLLLPVLADYFDTPAGAARAPAFLARNHSSAPGKYGDFVVRHASMVMLHVFNYHLKAQTHNMNGYFDGGNWRDSPAGNAYARWFFDVNNGLIPASVRAIQRLVNNGLIDSGDRSSIYASSSADRIADKYETYCPETFQAISLNDGECEALLKDYVDAAGLSPSLLYGAGSLNATATPGAGWNDPDQIVTHGHTKGFYSLVSEHDGTHAHIMHSDIAFPLLYSAHVPAELIRGTVRALQPYPRGLLTNVGMVVANAAYDGNKTNIVTFSSKAPHGAVVWGFQQALMAAGVARQLSACGRSNDTLIHPAAEWAPWCRDKKLVTALQQAQIRLWDSIEGSAPVLYNETWVPVWNGTEGRFTIGDLATLSPSAAEGNAFRLWSYGMLALVDPRTGRPIAEVFGHSDTR